MALSNYTNLQTAVNDYMARNDLASYVPDFITMAEARMNRLLRARQMETSYPVTMVSGSGTLPSDYLEWIAVVWNDDKTLRYVDPDSEEWRFRYRPHGDPTMFTIIGSAIQIRPIVNGDLTLYYYQEIPSLVTNNENWLMSQCPDAYLNYALAEGYIFIKDHNRAKDFMQLAEAELMKLSVESDSGKLARRSGRTPEIEDIAAARNPATSGR